MYVRFGYWRAVSFAPTSMFTRAPVPGRARPSLNNRMIYIHVETSMAEHF